MFFMCSVCGLSAVLLFRLCFLVRVFVCMLLFVVPMPLLLFSFVLTDVLYVCCSFVFSDPRVLFHLLLRFVVRLVC